MTFALPSCEPGGPDADAIAASIGGWVTSPALAELAGYFGGTVPGGTVAAVLDHVAEFSAAWDFRAGVRERFDTERVHYAPALDARLRELIADLGVDGSAVPSLAAYDHVLVLGGGIRVALGRSDYTARLLGGAVAARTVTGLGSLRWRDDREHREALRLGLDPVETEADMMLAGLRRFLDLPAEPTALRAGEDWWHRTWAAPRPGLEAVHVLAAASSRPGRRANTADTLTGWAQTVQPPARTDRVLLVTNAPYVLHQHCDAIRLLGHRYGCGIETISMDEASLLEWGRPLSTTELLQEVRSSLLAMRNLYLSLPAAAPPR
ncbi:hypothetical protein AB0M46_49350 [Dactylosporangium sp. NPDC051485]|uniref:hypothetical protein n=1 Tax=Dactylosporangium sp. NPDC051485 TaxID=3154846 RepID=UPI00344AF27A